ncbi:MAG TPA: hypothetical protein VLT85_10945 [Terriglobales bacterium]|nr:hypothetical protein [Terriglobales bacterium]
MRLGTESRGKVIAAVIMGALALVLLVHMLLPASPATPAPAARPQPQEAGRPGARRGAAAATASLDPTLRLDLLQASENTDYAGSGRNIFRPYEPPPPPVSPKDRNKQAESCILLHPGCPDYVPPPPPITLKFFGFASGAGGAKRVLLADGDIVFVAREGDIVNRRYKILKISSNSVEVEDVLNNNRQVLFLAQGPGS